MAFGYAFRLFLLHHKNFKMNKILIILIPYYNDLNGMINTLQSINEDIDINILIIDDGSKIKINQKQIKEMFSSFNISFDQNLINSGVGITLNRGLKHALKSKYKFIGRLDCGDICHKNKFSKQINYMLSNPKLKLLGTWARLIDEKGNFLKNLKHPTKYKSILKNMYFNSMFIHPTVIFSTDIIKEIGFYPVEYSRAAQDYAFFFKIIKKYHSENFPEILLDYVVSSKSVSHINRSLQVSNRIKIIIDNFYFGFTPIYSLMRNLMLLIIPKRVIDFIKFNLVK